MNPSSYNQPQMGAPTPNQAGQPTYASQPGVSAVPQHVPAFDAPIQSNPGAAPLPQAQPAQASPQFQQAPTFQQVNQAPQMPGAATAPQHAQPQVATVSGAATTKPGTTPAATNPNSTQNTLQIAEIRDGIVIMNDGSYRSVVMVKSINFDLMSQGEQEAVEFSYQGFLNSLYFPIQIFIRSQKVDLQPYITKLDKIRSEHDNMLLALLMEDYISYIDQLGQQTNIMDKKFYVVIPYFPSVDVQKALTQSKNFITGVVNLFDNKEQHVVINEEDLEKAKTELRNRVQAVT